MSTSAPEESGTGPPALSVGTVAQLLSTATSTLRTWDRRYGLGPSDRAGGSHRRYTPEDVSRLMLMRQLLTRGVGPAEAARVAARTPGADLPAAPTAPVHPLPVSPGLPAAVDPRNAPLDPETEAAVQGLAAEFIIAALESTPLSALPGPAGMGHGASGPGSAALPFDAAGPGRIPTQVRRIARAVITLDSPAITALMLDSTSRRGVVATWDSLVAPVLRAIGRQWEQFGSGIEIEHVFSETVLSVLRHRVVQLGGEAGNPIPALLACGPEESHSMPLHALAAALAERRVDARVLGARVPVSALVAALGRSQAPVTFLWSQAPATAILDLAALIAVQPAARVVVGGPGWDPRALDPAVLHVDDFGRAVDTLAVLAG